MLLSLSFTSVTLSSSLFPLFFPLPCLPFPSSLSLSHTNTLFSLPLFFPLPPLPPLVPSLFYYLFFLLFITLSTLTLTLFSYRSLFSIYLSLFQLHVFFSLYFITSFPSLSPFSSVRVCKRLSALSPSHLIFLQFFCSASRPSTFLTPSQLLLKLY